MSAMAYTAVRDLPKAEAAYRRLIELDPNNFEAYGRLGAIYLSQNRLDEARRSFEEMAQRQEKTGGRRNDAWNDSAAAEQGR